MVKKLKSFC